MAVTRGATFDNAKNLAPSFLASMRLHHEKRGLGRQELYGEFVEDTEGSLWTPSLIKQAIETYQPQAPLKRLIIAIDPAVSAKKTSDETGMIVAGLTAEGKGVVLEDLSVKGPPSLWIKKAIEAYHRLKADRIVTEVNMGGDLVEQLVRTYDSTVSYKAVRATRRKSVRAEPVVALYEQGKVWHADTFPALEEQLCFYIPGKSSKSPDRLDALVWALSELMLTPSFVGKIWTG